MVSLDEQELRRLAQEKAAAKPKTKPVLVMAERTATRVALKDQGVPIEKAVVISQQTVR